ncbi:NfeD family protein [Verrucomicrobiota bacterium]
MTLLFFILLAAGLFMICLEIFLPGGVIGLMGVLSLAGAVIIAFMAFGPLTGMYIAVSIIIVLGISMVLWIKYFPKTSVGKSMTLSKDGKDFKSSDNAFRELVGKEAETLTELRPAGIVQIDSSKYDVVTEGNLVDKGKTVRVIKVEGNRIVVRQVKEQGERATHSASGTPPKEGSSPE